jgi:hypothetical protein
VNSFCLRLNAGPCRLETHRIMWLYKPAQFVTILFCGAVSLIGAPDRIKRTVDMRHTRVVPGHLHRLARPEFDHGLADPAQPVDYIVLMTKPSAQQQTELDRLLADQQNPSSPLFRKWLTPEEFGSRFGLSPGDQSKVVAWLVSQGLTVKHLARGMNWIALSGGAAQVSRALNTPRNTLRQRHRTLRAGSFGRCGRRISRSE